MPLTFTGRLQVQFALALSAASALIYEVVATTILLFYVTESSYSIATVLSVFLGGLGIGSLIVYKFQHKIKRYHISFAVLQGMIAVYGILVFRHIPAIARQTSEDSLFITSTLLLLFPTVLLGAMFPLAAKMLQRKNKDVSGLVYSADIAGAVVGALLAGFLIIPKYGYNNAILIAVGLNVMAALFVLARKSRISIFSLIAVMFFGTVAISASIVPIENSDHWKDVLSSSGSMTFPSPYGEVTIRRDWLIINERVQCSYLFPDSATEKTIAKTALSIIDKDEPVFLNIGLGCAGTAKVLAEEEHVQIDVVEINPVVIELTRFYAKLSEIKNLNIITGDGFAYMRHHVNVYDSIIIDIEEPSVAHSSPLYTVESFQFAQKALKNDGAFLLWSYENDKDSRFQYIDIIYYSLRESFNYVYHKETYFIASDIPINSLDAYTPRTEKRINTQDRNILTEAYILMK